MSSPARTRKQILQENELLRARLEEAEAALEAIRSGEVDALIVSSKGGDQIFTLQGAENTYRVMVETMNEGAATLLEDGTVLFANPRLAAMLQVPLEKLTGASFLDYIHTQDWDTLDGLMEEGILRPVRAEMHLTGKGGTRISALISLSPTHVEGAQAVCLIATDLTEQKQREEILEAERLARSILSQAAEAILVCDLEGKVIRANEAAIQIWQQNLLYQSFEESFPFAPIEPCDDGRCFSLEKVFQGHSFQGLEVRLQPEKSTDYFYLLSAAPLLKEPEEIIGCVITLTDISDRKRMEQALQEANTQLQEQAEELEVQSEELRQQTEELLHVNEQLLENEERLRSHIENSPMAVVEWDANFTVTRWAGEAEKMFGWSEAETVGRRIMNLNLIYPEDIPIVEGVMLRLTDGHTRHVVSSNRNYTKDGKVIFCEWYNSVLVDNQGKMSSVLSLILDVTGRKRAEADRQAYEQQLERSNQELQDFAFVASHDLQEPLRKIRSFSNLLAKSAGSRLTFEELDYLERMQSASGRMQTMIAGLLALSRVTTQANPFDLVDLTQIAGDVVSDLETRIEQSQGKVFVDLLPKIEADPLQIRQLFQNLIGNALKFSRPEVPPKVIVSGKPLGKPGSVDQRIQITIKDNGIGFDGKQVKGLFQPFHRLVDRNEYEGTGMGLVICRKIVERHRGSITAESTPGNGSTFIITLPIRQHE